MPGIFNKITSGFQLGATDPITAGIEDCIYVCNKGDFAFLYDPNNPYNIIGIVQVIPGAKLFKFTVTNNANNATSKLVKSSAGPRYTEEIDTGIAGISSTLKQTLQALGYGRCQVITNRNWKTGDSVVELWGATNGLILSDAENSAQDETFEGGYKLKFTNPDKIREPYAPRAINISPYGPAISGTVPVVGTAIVGTATPAGLTATGSTTGGSLAAATYYYKIVSVDAQGTTLGSNEASATTTGTTSKVTLNWTGASGAVSYQVWRGTSAAGENLYYSTSSTSFIDTGAASTSGTFPATNTAIKSTATPSGVSATGASTGGVLAAATYYYVVTALDAQGETIGSSEVNATVTGTTSQVTIAWSAAAGASSYKVYKGVSASGENQYFQTTSLSFIDTGAVVAASYASTLAAINALAA